MERSEKKIVSNILMEPRKWIDVLEKKPPEDVPVVIRLCNENIIVAEDDENVIYAEDIKIGRLVDNETGFKIDAPFPRFDFSPLSDQENIKEGTSVTHWAYPSEGELEAWYTRFQPFREYKHLCIQVDDDNIKDVYRALLFGASSISRLYNFNPTQVPHEDASEDIKELYRFYEVLCDLQSYIDNPHAKEFNTEK